MFGPGSGGFLNMGTPEMIVIGACAWALLGPKELYRLAQEAGKFLGEWQQLGQQAKQTFTDALESELRDDEAAKRKEQEQMSELRAAEMRAQEQADMASAASASDAATSPSGLDLPTLSEYEEQRRKEMEEAPPLSGLASDDPLPEGLDLPAGTFMSQKYATAEEAKAAGELAMQARAEQEQSTFLDQISGETNKRVLTEFPPELNVEEDMMATRIAEAENQLAMLKTEAQVLELRRQQQEANAVRNARQQELDAQLTPGPTTEDAPEA